MILRGIAHVHSRWSYDGCHDLAEIAGFARTRGLDFVLMSEHDRTLTGERMAAFVRECDALTRTSSVLMVPGIECEATPDHVHVLGYGVRTLVRERRVAAIARAMRDASGFVVFAHPIYRDALRLVSREDIDALHGWEVWNGKADGGWYPSAESIRALGALHDTGAVLVPMAGADLHRLEAYPGIVLEVRCDAREAEDILGALGRRHYRMRGRAWTHVASAPLRAPALTPHRLFATATLGVRRRATRMHAWLAKRGLRAPAPVAHAARRLLK
jgi:predicted metal-dependent phosphoesterase TrpH